MKAWIFALACAFMVWGCTQSDSAVQGPGTGDSGGGNVYKGRPLDSYLRNPKDLQAYTQFIQPMIEAMNVDVGDGSEVQQLLLNIFANKSWYFVPGPLKSLPSSKIGAAVPTEQGALQDFNAVWIDTDIYDGMSAEDQARLLVHEVLIGGALAAPGFLSPLVFGRSQSARLCGL